MKKKILALTISSILSASAYADISNIVITEVVDNKAEYVNRALELTNTGTVDYTFPATIDIAKQVNGDAAKWYTVESATGLTIPAGKVVVIHGNEATSQLINTITTNGGIAVSESRNMNGTGNDAFAIRDITNPANPIILDAVGVIDNPADWAKDSTLSRKLNNGSIPSQNGGIFDINNWDLDNTGGFTGLGVKPGGTPTPPVVPPVTDACSSETQTSIASIQGDSKSSPLVGNEIYVTGIVTKTTTVPTKGAYIQSVTEDGDIKTSDGIFVESLTGVVEGNTICLKGTIEENYGLTQIINSSDLEVTDASSSVPPATDLSMIPEDNGSFAAMLERYEGMLVNFPADIDATTAGNQDMRVTKTIGFNYDSYRNNMVFAYKRPNMVPTQDHIAGSSAADDYANQNNDYRLIIESSEKAKDGEIPYYPTFNSDAKNNYIRIDDSVTGMEGVISYGYGDFNLVVTNDVNKSNFKHNSDRKNSPDLNTDTDDNHFAIKVGTQNVLNLFNSPFGGDYNTHGENRGADSNDEFLQQKAKLVAAIKGLDADIVGLMEIENNGFGSGSAIKEFVDAINENYYDEDPKDSEKDNSTSKRYVFIGYDSNQDLILDELDSVGSDAITTGLLYRPAKISIERVKVIPMPSQHAPAIVNDSNITVKDKNGALLESGDNYQRDSLTATFIVNNTSKRLTVAVNHFKSKGSTCWEEWKDVEFGDEETWTKDAPNQDFQGSCEHLRVAAAVQLGDELAKIGGDTIIVGDLNSYAKEDPLLVLTKNSTGKTLTTARDTFIGKKAQFNTSGSPITVAKSYGYINAVAAKDEEKGQISWSYSYNDEIGSLDHILISPLLEERVIDAVDWHINAAESTLYDYNINYKGAHADKFYVDDAFRSSDHDSAIISLSYQYAEVSNGQDVHIVINGGLIKVPYAIPTNDEGVKDGDVAHITLSANDDDLDMKDIILPRVTLKDGQTFVIMEVHGVKPGSYNATMTLQRDNKVISDFTHSIKIQVAKKDSTTAKVAPPAAYDGSGGSFGIWGVLSLIGLGFMRRRNT